MAGDRFRHYLLRLYFVIHAFCGDVFSDDCLISNLQHNEILLLYTISNNKCR